MHKSQVNSRLQLLNHAKEATGRVRLPAVGQSLAVTIARNLLGVCRRSQADLFTLSSVEWFDRYPSFSGALASCRSAPLEPQTVCSSQRSARLTAWCALPFAESESKTRRILYIL